VIVLGDMTNGSTKEFDPGELQEYTKLYYSIADSLTMPVKLVAGNHDVLNVPTKQAYDFYLKNYGKLWYSFEYMNTLFIVLESNVLKNPQKMTGTVEEQMNWLTALLKDSQQKNYNNKLVFMHHSLCKSAAHEKEGYFILSGDTRKKLIQLFHDYGVRALFTGHFHRHAYERDGDLELVTITSTGFQEGKDKPGFMVLKVDTNGIKHAFYTYKEMPEYIEGEDASLSLTHPNGGENLIKGKMDTITWNSRSMAPFVKLEYTTGTEWQVITDSTSNNGFFPWAVPDRVLSGVKVRISTLTSKVSDESDGGFRIKEKVTAIGRHDNIESGFLFEVKNMRYRFPKPLKKVQIYGLNGELVKELIVSNRHLIWDGKNLAGRSLLPGVYIARVGSYGIRLLFAE
jgi:predicted phosphodiesterase